MPGGAAAPLADGAVSISDIGSEGDGAAGSDRALTDLGAFDAGAEVVDAEVIDVDGSAPIDESLELELSSLSVAEAESIDVTVFRVDEQGSREAVDAGFLLHVGSATVARAESSRLLTLAPGRTRVHVTIGSLRSRAVQVEVRPRGELRGVWVSRWLYSNPGDLDELVADVVGANMNAIFLQVRGEADAFYDSTHEPWSRILSGTLGQDPGWDPLQTLIQKAHAEGVQVHAWINTFPAWQSSTPPAASTPEHPLRAHPEWLCANANGVPMAPGESSYQFFSPGNPAVREHIATVLEELADRYEIDGLHMDYVRYPGATYCHDAASEAEFSRLRAADPGLLWEDFQRDNVGRTIEAVRQRLNSVRPNAVLTAATWGIYKNKWNWSSVSKGYSDYYQDAHAYIGRGLLDALVPMTYWASTPVPGERLDFATLTEDHVQAASSSGRYAFAGISAEHDGDEILRQVQIARDKGARGVVFFEIGEMRTQGHLARLRQGPFSASVEVPPFGFR